MNYALVTTDAQLAAVCQQASLHSDVAIDTEFVRTRTYYPRVGLIQLYDGSQLVLIDPLTIEDWQPFIALLKNTAVRKFLHAGGEDLEVFLHQFNTLPEPMVDTQILSAFAGHPNCWGFSAMVAYFTGVELDKSEVRTDWLARPLTLRQCDYAAADVSWLLPIARQLIVLDTENGHLAAALNECELLCQRRRIILPASQAWQAIGQVWQLKPRQFAALQMLAAWRLDWARQQDMAVNFVVREAHLWQVARHLPASLTELQQLGLTSQEIRHHGKTLLEHVAAVRELNGANLPASPVNLAKWSGYKQAVQAIKALISRVSQQTGLSTELLASKRQINQLFTNHWGLRPALYPTELLTGWRGELLQADILAILADIPAPAA